DGEITGLAWSPDSAWLAYCEPVEAGLTRIMIAGPADGTLVAVTEPRFTDADPVFTSDGRYLAFLSRRSFDPIYDEHSFDLTFPAAWRPFLVPLAARTPSPFGASPDGRPVSASDEGPEDPPAEEVPTEEEKKRARDEDPPEVVVDIEGLAARVVPIPVVEGRYRGMTAAKDCLLWHRLPVNGELGDGRAGGGGHERLDFLAYRSVETVTERTGQDSSLPAPSLCANRTGRSVTRARVAFRWADGRANAWHPSRVTVCR
nr:PD40 domain-containing protein [Chloroflexota bacterium]